MMDVDKLYDMLRKVQEPKGYYFNKDKERTFELLEALLANKERYGYMACPCRLAAGDRDWDKDIICPCVYRTPDVKSTGAATAISTSPGTGTRGKFPTPTSRSEDLQKRSASSPDVP